MGQVNRILKIKLEKLSNSSESSPYSLRPIGITDERVMASTSLKKAPWQAQGQEKRTAVRRMFSEIAPTYDLLNSIMSFCLHGRWRAFACRKLELHEGDRALDICCGTGDFMKPLKSMVGGKGSVSGVDFCLPMLERAKAKVGGGLALGDACALPVRSETLDGASVGWGIRNVPDVDRAHAEIARVLKKGGRFVSVDMARPTNRVMAAASDLMFHKVVPRLGALFGKTEAYTYLPESTKRFMTREELKESMVRAGFSDVGYKNLFFGNICVHWGTKA
jgi:demethylmenaquinone methyltransferase / 2-methoxy-6-polyprenyl-1,4-benzoquinol methylase